MSTLTYNNLVETKYFPNNILNIYSIDFSQYNLSLYTSTYTDALIILGWRSLAWSYDDE